MYDGVRSLQQRPATTDYLARVIQMLQLGKRTGILAVERGEHATFEEGVLVFVNGQITEAKVGLRFGRNALNWLSMWGLCRFIFTPAPPSPPALPAPRSIHTPIPTQLRAHTTQKLPALQSNTDPLQARVTQKLPALPANFEDLQPRTTQKLTAIKLVKPVASSQNGYATPHPSPAPVVVIPYHTRPIDEAVRLLEERQLPRTHKHLLLLIDGRRTTLDLMRLMGRTPEDMSRLLGDLRYLGLIGLRV